MLTPEEAAPFDEVWFVDLCPQDLNDPSGGKPFWVCDHHITNIERHSGNPNCTFDIKYSGTSLLAKELGFRDVGEGSPVKHDDGWELINGLQDYDLGRFGNFIGQRLADCAGTMSQEEMLDMFIVHGTEVWTADEVVGRAAGAAGARLNYAKKAAESALYMEFRPPGWGVASGTVNAGISISPEPWKNAVAEEILKKAELAIVFDSTSWTCSFRTKTLDVSKMAEEYGGGGHKRASGFKISSHDALRALLEEIFG